MVLAGQEMNENHTDDYEALLEPEADDQRRHRTVRIRPRYVAVAMVLAVAAFLLVGWVDVYSDWLWFRSVGFETVYTTVLVTKLVSAAVAGVVTAIVMYANLALAVRLAPQSPFRSRVVQIDQARIALPDLGDLVAYLPLPVALVAGLVAAKFGWESWELFQLFLYQVPFGVTDPVFGRDVGFYVFTLPVLEWVEWLALFLVLGSLAGTIGIYGARGGLYLPKGRLLPMLDRGPRRHVLWLVAALAIVVAAHVWLEIPNLLFSTSGPVAGACYTDLQATLPLLWVRVFVALLAAVVAAVSAYRHGSGLLLAGIAVYGIVLIGGGIYTASVQKFSVAPNEVEKETPYIERNIEATRRAFRLDAVDERELTGEVLLTARDIDANRNTVDSIRLWDMRPLLDTFAQIQEIRTYYEFQNVDNDRYVVNGVPRQVMLSARELSIESLPNRNWINERLTFTHGYGLALGPVTAVTPEGLPVLFVKDIPPAAPDPVFAVTRPELYFGELSSDHVYVRTNTAEFDYPSGDNNVFATYEGRDGVSIGSGLRQVLFGLRLGDMKLLLSDAMTPDSRVMLNRKITERLSLVAPFLVLDKDPYLVIHEGRLVWILDGYTTTDRYPYSQPYGPINYISNSVKATIDAYDGTVTLYIADPSDPIIQTYSRIFPGVMHSLDELPAGLRAHLRYPEDIFRVQTGVYATYHMNGAQMFYNREDVWEVASLATSEAQGKEEPMVPYYTIMRLPGGTEEEFIQMLPFTPKSKDNLASWMVARTDGENYGKLVVYRFPKQRLVYGPKQIVARFNQDPEISRQLTLWNQRGSQVMFGNLMVIPIDASLLYVQPLYLRAESGKIPELRRVIVATDNRIAMGETLDKSLAMIFGSAPAKEEGAENAPAPGDQAAAGVPSDLALEARRHYESALEAQRAGDWARYGEEIRQLGLVLERMTPKP